MRTRKSSSRRLGLERLEDRAVPATLYVGTTGSDFNDGSSDSPWRTLQHAADQVGAGDTVIVRPGTYVGFDLRTDGTAANRIVFSAQPGATITSRNIRTDDGINLEGADYVTIEGFTINGIGRAGIRSVINTGVIIRSNSCDQNGRWGIFTGFSENILIQNNVTTRSGAEHGIYFSNSADNPIIRGNTSWGNRGCGIHMNGDLSQGGDGIISNALVENNVVYSNGLGGGSGINCDGVRNSVIRNNLLYDAQSNGISLYQIDGGGASTGNRLVNNTILVGSNGRWAINIQDGATGTVVRNNVLHSAHSFRGAITISADSLTGLVSNFNIVEGVFSVDDGNTAISFSQWRTLTGLDSGSITTANPSALFANAAGGDYHLASGSTAIDAGTSNGAPETDFEGTARPSGSGYDIGHDEFGGTSPPPPPPPPPPPSPPPPPPPLPPSAQPFTVGTPATVTMFNPDQTVRFSAQPFGPSYTRGVRVAAGDVTGDGVQDVVAATSGGSKAEVRVIDGLTGAVLPTPLFMANSYQGAVSVSVGDVTADGVDDIVLGTNDGGPHVRVFRGGDFSAVADFWAGNALFFRGNTQVALGEMTGDDRADLVVTALYSAGSRVLGYRAESLALGVKPVKAFKSFTMAGNYVNGLFLAVGDVNGDGVGDLVFGSRGTVVASVKVFSGDALISSNTRTRIAGFIPETHASPNVRVAVRDVDGDGEYDIITSAGGLVSAYSGGGDLPRVGEPGMLFSFDPDPAAANGAVWVG